MLKAILCRLFGHRWALWHRYTIGVHTESYLKCDRCGRTA